MGRVRHTMGRWVDILWVGGSIYHRKGGRYAMVLGVDIPWVGGRYTMGRRVDIPWVGGRYTIGMGSIYHG